jgi:origin recognition complex subunit 5
MTQVSPEAYNNIIRNFPGRQDQIDLLLRLFRRPQDPVPCLFLYGATGSGKTLLMREVMKLIGARHCLVNSLECYSQRLLFESALNQLDQEGILKNKTCAELSRFVALLDQLLTKEMNTSYLIFDKAERLRGEFQFIVNALLRLNEQTDRNVCVIFLSRVSFDEFRDDSGSPEPISIHFPSYNRVYRPDPGTYSSRFQLDLQPGSIDPKLARRARAALGKSVA